MNWSNAKLILCREIRDQLRDRRTLFMIAVLPILLYPFLGMSILQVAQFMEEKPSHVLVAGAKDVANSGNLPPLFDAGHGNRFDGRLFTDPERTRLLELNFLRDEPVGVGKQTPDPRVEARRAVQIGKYDAAVYFPVDLVDELEAFRQAIQERATRGHATDEEDEQDEQGAALRIRSPEIIYSTASEKSQIAFARLSAVLQRWTEEIGKENLVAGKVPAEAARPFDIQAADVAEQTAFQGAALWSKVLPVLLVLWALTGAFYPAVDLCAGEKERGTLETLLSSPAERSEIVLGKLLTIMIFSMATAVLNLVSMGITGWLILGRLEELGTPPLIAVVWLSIALVPVSALFSALCLALAAFARSTKEGQYYLMPLLLITMPLVILPMAPGVQLNLGNSLIPVTGVVLLLRSLLEGSYWQAVQFLPPVAAVTLAACLLSIRWAIDQFNSESVLFREGERLDVGLWLRHLFEDRGPTPTVAGAVFCGVVILVTRFFMSLALPAPSDFRGFAVLVVVTQLVVIATPALLMTVMLTRSPRQTLLLRRPPWLAIPAAVLLAILLHPSAGALQSAVIKLYPPSQQMMDFMRAMQQMFVEAPLWQAILVIAVVPAVCEELAFRGFILSGLRHLGHKWRAIIFSALFFGLSHALLQQSIIAFLVGLVIGFLVVQSGSIWPAVVFHLVHNCLGVAASRVTPDVLYRIPVLRGLFGLPDESGMLYGWPVVVASGVLSFGLLIWFHYLPYPKSDEEKQQEAIVGALHADV